MTLRLLQIDSLGSNSDPEEEPDIRGDVREWYTCQNCTNQHNFRQRLRCQELERDLRRTDEAIERHQEAEAYTCICNHLGFLRVCLEEVLQCAWLAYKQQYGIHAYNSLYINKKYRRIAYRKCVRFLLGIVKKDHRSLLPSRAVNFICRTFPSERWIHGTSDNSNLSQCLSISFVIYLYIFLAKLIEICIYKHIYLRHYALQHYLFW